MSHHTSPSSDNSSPVNSEFFGVVASAKMSMFDILDNASEIVCLAGRNGVLWSEVANKLSIKSHSPIATHVFNRFKQCNYVIDVVVKPSDEITPENVNGEEAHDFLIKSSVEDTCRSIGMKSETD